MGASRGLRFRTTDDYTDYIARLNEFPRYFDENIANMQRGIDDGFVLPRIVIDGVAPTVRGQITATPEESSLYDPLRNIPESIDASTAERLREETRAAITDSVFVSLARFAGFLEGSYGDAATKTIGAFELPGGGTYYRQQIRRYATVTDLTPEEIHAMGRAEVARIRAEMDEVIESTASKARSRNSPSSCAPTRSSMRRRPTSCCAKLLTSPNGSTTSCRAFSIRCHECRMASCRSLMP